ncbi:MAG TPA: ABC transporter ATP-binding protein [Mucilaginibacter sp.]|jgi:ABC-2 type transport system ATP-binding protein|nr:ABC transporter ATP-binding protein [Mucilaginibacter sp.]
MAVNNSLAIDIENMGFRYPGNSELFISGLNLQVQKGERFGLFGPNAAGKTTLISLMTGLLSVDEGHIRLFGREVGRRNNAVSKLFGFVPQDFSFYQELTPVENLEFFGAWSGLDKQTIRKRTDELLHILGLEEVRNKQVQKFSGGMKRRVNLAIGVFHKPQILFLDEPTVGVDVQTRYAIIKYLLELNKHGTTLIYTSHQLSEAEGLCEQVALIDDGKIIAHDDLDKLLKDYHQDSLEHLFLNLTGKGYRNDV